MVIMSRLKYEEFFYSFGLHFHFCLLLNMENLQQRLQRSIYVYVFDLMKANNLS